MRENVGPQDRFENHWSSAPVVNFINTKAAETDQQPPLLLNWPDQYPRSLNDLMLFSD